MSCSKMAVTAVGVLLLFVAAIPVVAQDGPPQWILDINPGDYVLLQTDLTGPLAGCTIIGEINAQAQAQGYTVVGADGQPQTHRTFILWADETIGNENFHRSQVKDQGGADAVINWEARWQFMIEMYETPEIAKLSAAGRWGDGLGRDFTETALGHPALRGHGEATASGDIVRYKNCIFRMVNVQVSEVRKNRQPVWMDEWNKAQNETLQKASQMQATIAKAWLDKLSNIQPPQSADLVVDPGWFVLNHLADNTLLPYEQAADKQVVAFTVKNFSATTAAKNVFAQLYAAYGEEEAQPLGDPISLGEIAPQGFKETSAIWDLNGKNVEKARLYLQVWIPGVDDVNPDNNVAGLEVSIYYAHNGERAFSWFDDTFSFENYTFKDREIEEMVEGVLATAIGNMSAESDMNALLQRLFFPQTYLHIKEYLDVSAKQGSGGHCYGISAIAALYFEDASLNPLPKSVPEMTVSEASMNINIYHRAQMVPVFTSALTGRKFAERDYSVTSTLNEVRRSLRDDKKSVIIEFFGQNGGHAVLAYKLIEIEGRKPVVYLYDSNFPQSTLRPPRAMTQFVLSTNPDRFSFPDYMGYGWAYASWMSARRPHRDISLEETNALIPGLKKSLKDMLAFLHTGNQLMAVLRCPADAVFTDPQGRRVGVVGGQVVNEIPGAEVRSHGEVEIYVLPANLQYKVTITGNGQGTAGFDIITAESADRAGLTCFAALPVSDGSSATADLLNGGQVAAVVTGGQTIAPTMVASYDGEQGTWHTAPGQKPPYVTPAPTTPPTRHDGDHIALTREEFIAGEEILIRWKDLPGGFGDWIAVVPADDPDNSWGNWWYTRDHPDAEHTITIPTAGEYEVRVYFDWPAGGYNVQSRLRFTVR